MTSGRAELLMREHETRSVALGPADVELLLANHRGRVSLTSQGRGRWLIRTRSWVGSLGLPSMTLRILPKCGLANLLRMLSEVYELGRVEPELVTRHELDDPAALLVTMFVARVQQLLRRGVRRSYCESEHTIAAIRGRLLVTEALRRPGTLERGLPCRFDEYTHDITANRVIRYTLAQLGPTGVANLDGQVRQLRREFASVGFEPVTPAALQALRYDRLDRHYAPIHALCRLLLEARGLGERDGAHTGPSLLVDMNRLFEQFVARRLRALAPRGWTLTQQTVGSLDQRGRIRAIPDLILRERGEPRLVLDTKYKLHQGLPRSADAFQALAYARALGVRHGVLLYPEIAGPHRYVVVDGANEVIADGVDLSRPWVEIDAGFVGLMSRLLTTAESCR